MRWTALCIGFALCASGSLAGEARDVPAVGIDSVGSASRRVPLDTLEVVFALKTERDSFGAAKAAADAVFARALAKAQGLGLPSLRDHYDFAALSQDFFSVGRSGSEVQHRLRLTCQEIAPEQMHATAVALIDAVLEADRGLWVAEMSASLSEESDAKLRSQLIALAAADAAAQARPLAESSGRRLGPALHVKARCATSGRPDPELGGIEGIATGAYRTHAVSTRKSFDLHRAFESEVERSCGVTARFGFAAS